MSIKVYHLNELAFKNEIIDRDHQFSLGYFKEFDIYVMKIMVWWVACYDRYYRITKEDFELYQKNKTNFYKKYETEINQNSKTCFNENFIGAIALRDYDGAPNFQRLKPSKDGQNPFVGHTFLDNVFYAVIEWENETVYVPPVQVVNNNFPLHDKCKMYNIDGKPACFVKII